MGRWPLPLLAAVSLLAGCTEKLPEEKPPAPDMSAVISAYQKPTLSIDSSNLASIASSTIPIGSSVQELLALVTQAEAAISQGASAQDQKSQSRGAWQPGLQTQAVDGDAFMKVHRICPGWVPGEPPNEANGAVDLIVGLTEDGFDPVIWGTSTACKLGTGSASMQVNGTLSLFIGDNTGFDSLETTKQLFQLSVDLIKGESTEHVETDFRLGPDSIEYRVFAGDAFAVYFEEAGLRGYRAANGKFTCDFENQKCAAESGETLSW